MPKTKQTISGGWGEALGIFLMAGGLLAALSLFSFDPGDVSAMHVPPNDPPVNFIGPLGAWFSFILFMALGCSAYVMPLALALFGLFYLLKKQASGWGKVAWTAATVLSLAVLIELQSDLWEPLRARLNIGTPGGLLGDLLAGHVLIPLLGGVGTGILSTALLVASLVFLFELKPADLFVQLKERIAAWYEGIQTRRALTKDDQALLELEKKKLEKKRKELEKTLKQQIAEQERAEEEKRKAAKKRPLPELNIEEPEPEPAPPAPKPEKKLGLSKVLPPLKKDKEEAPPPPPPQKPKITIEDNREKPKPQEDESLPEGIPYDPATYRLPPLNLLDDVDHEGGGADKASLQETAASIQDTLQEFGVDAQVTNAVTGPVVTRFEILPAAGVKVEKIAGLENNLALALKAQSLRIQAPVPGKGVVGIEVPNAKSAPVFIKELISDKNWAGDMALPLALGKDVAGKKMISDLAEMPHLLIAGSTGAGKTVCMNSILTGLLMSRTPEELKLILVDPKIVEFSGYNHLPHLVVPVITDAKKVPHGLRWAVDEMKRRYEMFGKVGVRNIKGFNSRPIESQPDLFGEEQDEEAESKKIPDRIPYIVVIVDELADLMLVAQAEIENYIARLAQLSRAVGIHMILATQRPSVNVITGTIKANFPARIAFKVAQMNDSRTILDAKGAEQLLGKGDMLFAPPGSPAMVRGQGAWTKDHEIKGVVDFIKAQGTPKYEQAVQQKLESKSVDLPDAGGEDDEMLEPAIEIIRQTQRASTSSLQRRLRIGYTRAARLMDLLEEKGIVGPPNGSEPREILIDLDGEIPQNPNVEVMAEEDNA